MEKQATRKHCSYTDDEIEEIVILANAFAEAVRKVKPRITTIVPAAHKLVQVISSTITSSPIEMVPEVVDDWEKLTCYYQ